MLRERRLCKSTDPKNNKTRDHRLLDSINRYHGQVACLHRGTFIGGGLLGAIKDARQHMELFST